MKNFMKAIAALMLMIAVACAAGCEKTDIPNNGGSNNGNGNGEEPKCYNITVSANPSDGGTVSGGGNFKEGQSCIVTATPASGYSFTNWTENDSQVSTNASYTFSVTCNRSLVANFTHNGGGEEPRYYTVSVSEGPTGGGTVWGGGTYQEGQSCTVTATPTPALGYTFTKWTEDGSQVSTDADYTFTVTKNRNLVAYFSYDGSLVNAPTGAINGTFTINADGDKVYFSQGNLQYQASTNTWRFAENQQDYIGDDNKNISSFYSGWIDLFGWGTSGYHDDSDPYNVHYQPWSNAADIVNEDYNYYGYGPSVKMPSPDLTGSSANYDWGVYNPISNGGNQTGQWRTLTLLEWNYIFAQRQTASGIRYAKVQIRDPEGEYLNGMILLPDDWDVSYYSPLSNVNTSSAGFGSNIIYWDDWTEMEQHGAVFLPLAGMRSESGLSYVGSVGYYWAASYEIEDIFLYSGLADVVAFHSVSLGGGGATRCAGRSVRLVCPAR